LQKLALNRMRPHVLSSGRLNMYQSTYRPGHSTETAPLKVVDDIQRTTGDGKCTVLLALDISAAFDAVDHSVLGARVNTDFDIGGTVGRWIRVLRRRQVAVGAERSEIARFASGVPRGSILGPLLFAMYVSPIGQVVVAFGIQHRQYADDLMLYCALTASKLHDLSPLYSTLFRRRIVSEMTYAVSSGTLNSTIPYHTIRRRI